MESIGILDVYSAFGGISGRCCFFLSERGGTCRANWLVGKKGTVRRPAGRIPLDHFAGDVSGQIFDFFGVPIHFFFLQSLI